jgi:hypothetical protein
MTIKKVIVIGLIVIMLESIVGYIYLTYREKMSLDPLPQPNPSQQQLVGTPTKKPTLALRTDQASLKKNETITINAVLEGQGNRASAADLTIRYDPEMLNIIATNSATPFAKSQIFQKTVFNAVDTKTGLATMSAVSEIEQPLPDLAFLTSIVFKALKEGPTEITIVFTPDETRDTNIVSESEDILGSVENLPITIQP